jgi:hypothetical protein
MSSKKLEAGGEIDAYCTKCKLDLGHRIVAMVGSEPKRVECMTCRSQHNYRRPKSPAEDKAKAPRKTATRTSGGSSSKSSSVRAVAAMEAELARERDWEKSVSGRSPDEFKPYSITGNFTDKDLIRHKKFGDGVVLQVVDKNKIEVMFREGSKVLAHGMEAPQL